MEQQSLVLFRLDNDKLLVYTRRILENTVNFSPKEKHKIVH